MGSTEDDGVTLGRGGRCGQTREDGVPVMYTTEKKGLVRREVKVYELSRVEVEVREVFREGLEGQFRKKRSKYRNIERKNH